MVTDTNVEGDAIVIYALPGSQFVFKVLAALQSRNIPHFVYFVPLELQKRRKVLPSSGTMVPEMKVGVGEKAAIVPDSEAILHWLDDNRTDTRFFPTEITTQLSQRASGKTLAGMVWYYNWVDPIGYKNSMFRSTRKFLPTWISWIPDFALDMMLASTRKKHRDLVKEALQLGGGEDEAILDDEARMRARLIDELKYFQSFLKKPSNQQPYLLEGTSEPNAADFSVYAQVERLVGAGTASDVEVYPCLQELKDDRSSHPGLDRFWEWHDHMRATIQVHYKGKRPPASLTK